jgi:predicted enzyme related to lactoylglutathione lyase
MVVAETFFSLGVRDMERATAFYVGALGASVSFSSPGWSSLHIAGVRVGLFPDPEHEPSRVGLHFVVDDLAAAEASVKRVGGRVEVSAAEVAPGVLVSDVTDTEGNTFSLRRQ